MKKLKKLFLNTNKFMEKTVVEKIFDMIEDGKFSDLVERKEWFMMEEKKHLESSFTEARSFKMNKLKWLNFNLFYHLKYGK